MKKLINSLALVLVLIIFMFVLSHQAAPPMEADTPITGLPVYLRNVAASRGRPMSYHTLVRQLSEFFTWPINYEHARVNAFVFVKVLDTEKYIEQGMLRQNSTLQVLSTVWSRDAYVGEKLNLVQHQFGRFANDKGEICHTLVCPTLVREGAVYLLPLIYWPGNNDSSANTWSIRSAFSVLFEVDDRGHIWSNTHYESFNRFDGKDARVVVDAIRAITEDENFDSATTTGFGTWAASESSSFVEATVLSITREEGIPQLSPIPYHYRIVLRIDDVVLPSTLFRRNHVTLPRDEPWPSKHDEYIPSAFQVIHQPLFLSITGATCCLLHPISTAHIIGVCL